MHIEKLVDPGGFTPAQASHQGRESSIFKGRLEAIVVGGCPYFSQCYQVQVSGFALAV